ncbi:stage V sporulation protein D (sporulation-specific penicillin-binding protein) [Paenibacillus cellulosilyticus]|uniref:Stage V sporulation protein D (Sporulation-specific penicillin-binding protein) n=1 Tax=Paenibacillus cellulosilyticus TaxID=375489 RepID=A0A2V2YQP8_9BACL|nr:stage V sporulation protein D [Paenibacillus cellulosilyticus]PWV95460.1 stage V sporulation protein D (sporulation-specific penicillin-binding protein) [Paenibacillus cellulosilyticus]QKS43165.1 stage V sporulation protein D [Paenibacillus cellulosilyticus]
MKVSNVTVRRRLFAALLVGIIAFFGLIGRLAYVQLWKGEELAAKAEDSWRREVPFTAKRGEILDRNGVRLAYNISSPTIWAIPVQIKDKEATARALAPVLGMSEMKLLPMLQKKTRIVQLKPEGRKITLEKAQEVRALALPGIMIGEDNKRYYPYGTLAAHVLGFTGIDNQGLTGVEAKYNQFLEGIQGNVAYLADAAGNPMPGSGDTYNAPKDGLSLQLTLDKQIQTIMEREMDAAVARLHPDHIIAIAMNPNNGEVLGMASRPTFQPDQYREVPKEVYDRNLPVWMTYEPGSTFKIITLAAAIEEKKVDLLNERFFDPGAVEVGGARLRCWKKGGHGSQSFLEVVQNSCNPGFVALGQRLGKETLFDYIKKFGFGSKTGIDINGEENGILFKLSQVGPVELATTAFGQGVSVTPIQQITAVAAAINGGTLYKPHIAKGWINPDTGETVESIEPEVVRKVISESTSKQVREALETVVAQGTGGNAFIDGYRVGGKTGTAQKVINGRYSPNEHIVSFVGFAPADDPQIVVYLAVDNPQGIQFGGVVAAPIVRNILDDSLHYLGIPPRTKQVDKEYKLGENKIVTVPNIVGKTVSDLYEDLNMNFNLSAAGTGQTVIRQAPSAGTRVEKGSTIRIYLGSEENLPDSADDGHDHE